MDLVPGCVFARLNPTGHYVRRWAKNSRMENILNLVGEYWPHLLGLSFFAVMAFNARSWFKERRAQG